MIILDFILNQLLRQPVIFIGLLVALGNILVRKGFVQVISSAFTTMVGLQLIIFGGNQFGGLISPITDAIKEAFGIQGYVMDQVVMNSVAINALTDAGIFQFVGYVFLIAFAVNLILVLLGKYTKVRGLFLTGNAGVSHSQAILWLVFAYLGSLGNTLVVIIAGVLVGLYWSLSTTLAIKPVDKITDGMGGFTIGHNQTLAFWFYSKFAHLFGDPEKDNAENLNLPGWLAIFDNNVIGVAIIMSLFCGGFLLTLGWEGAKAVAGGTNVLIYIFMIGIQFSAFMVIVLQGVRMLTSELTTAFQGIQEKIAPNAVPAIDVAAILGFGPTSATLGFIFTTFGTILAMLALYLVKSPVMVLPGFLPLFFVGGPIGVLANKYGGWKSILVCCISVGIIQTFGTVWALSLTTLPGTAGWSGMFDFATFWPAVTEVLKAVGNVIH